MDDDRDMSRAEGAPVPEGAGEGETVQRPPADDAPPTRSRLPFVWLGLILLGALLVAALMIVLGLQWLGS